MYVDVYLLDYLLRAVDVKILTSYSKLHCGSGKTSEGNGDVINPGAVPDKVNSIIQLEDGTCIRNPREDLAHPIGVRRDGIQEK